MRGNQRHPRTEQRFELAYHPSFDAANVGDHRGGRKVRRHFAQQSRHRSYGNTEGNQIGIACGRGGVSGREVDQLTLEGYIEIGLGTTKADDTTDEVSAA